MCVQVFKSFSCCHWKRDLSHHQANVRTQWVLKQARVVGCACSSSTSQNEWVLSKAAAPNGSKSTNGLSNWRMEPSPMEPSLRMAPNLLQMAPSLLPKEPTIQIQRKKPAQGEHWHPHTLDTLTPWHQNDVLTASNGHKAKKMNGSNSTNRQLKTNGSMAANESKVVNRKGIKLANANGSKTLSQSHGAFQAFWFECILLSICQSKSILCVHSHFQSHLNSNPHVMQPITPSLWTVILEMSITPNNNEWLICSKLLKLFEGCCFGNK